MKKALTFTFNQAFFFRNVLQGTIKAKTEEDIMNKVRVFDSLTELKAKLESLNALSEEEKKAFDVKELDTEFSVELDSEVIDWLKAKWKDVPADYKLYSPKGDVVQDGLASEEECRKYSEVKIALEDARVLK